MGGPEVNLCSADPTARQSTIGDGWSLIRCGWTECVIAQQTSRCRSAISVERMNTVVLCICAVREYSTVYYMSNKNLLKSISLLYSISRRLKKILKHLFISITGLQLNFDSCLSSCIYTWRTRRLLYNVAETDEFSTFRIATSTFRPSFSNRARRSAMFRSCISSVQLHVSTVRVPPT